LCANMLHQIMLICNSPDISRGKSASRRAISLKFSAVFVVIVSKQLWRVSLKSHKTLSFGIVIEIIIYQLRHVVSSKVTPLCFLASIFFGLLAEKIRMCASAGGGQY